MQGDGNHKGPPLVLELSSAARLHLARRRAMNSGAGTKLGAAGLVGGKAP